MTGWLRCGALVAAVAVLVAGCSSSQHGAPYRDARATGGLTLCDRSGHAITNGSINDTPFIYRAVSAVGATGAYAGPGRTATLYAFQPRRGVDAAGWSGGMLTSSSTYTNVAHPMSQLTTGDLPLASFLSTFPASWDGSVELRLYLGAPNTPLQTASYAALDLHVTGTHWKVLHPVSVSCTSGSATSLETQLLPSTTP